jgi:cytoskeletal protein RodZ
VVGSLAAFVLGMLAVTGVEWLRGESLSGGSGTTFGSIVDPHQTGGQEQRPVDRQGDPSAPPTSTTTTTPPTDPTGPTSTTTTTTTSPSESSTTTTTTEPPVTTTTSPPVGTVPPSN